MNFWFSSSNGVTIAVLILMFSAGFCDRDLSTEANEVQATTVNGTLQIPCSLDDINGNGTDCNSSSPMSPGLSESQKIPNHNSTDDSRSSLCPPDGCSTNDEQRDITISHVIPSISSNAFDNFSKTDNQREATITMEHFTAISTTPNEANTSCPFGGCLESNGSESLAGDALISSANSSNLTENFETTSSAITFGLDETLIYKTSSIDSPLVTAKTAEAISNFTDTVISTEDLENSSMATTEFSNISSMLHTVEVNNSTETYLGTNHSTVTEEEKNMSTLTSTNEPFDNITEHIETTTVYNYSITNPQSPSNNTDIISPDNSTVFYTSPTSSTNISTSVNETTEFSTDTSSNPVTDITTMTNTESSSVPPQRVNIIVELRINCSDSGQERELDLLVAQLLNATLKNNDVKECSNLHNVTLSVMHGSTDFTTIHRILSEKLKNAEVLRIIYDGSSATTSFKNTTTPSPPDNDVTQSEMILYITLGVSLGAIFLIALAIICFKCCRRRPSKPVDLDVPHLNLRLEDYTLTRIPRPNTCYLDYFRGPLVSDHYSAPSVRNSMNAASESNRGMVQPFDTSVVPLEDAKKLDQLVTSPNRTSCPSTPLRTFGRKDCKHRDKLIYENVISSSTEKLHPDFYKYGYTGTENPTFAA